MVGRTALHIACASNQMSTAIFLITHADADINAIDKGGRTPLDIYGDIIKTPLSQLEKEKKVEELKTVYEGRKRNGSAGLAGLLQAPSSSSSRTLALTATQTLGQRAEAAALDRKNRALPHFRAANYKAALDLFQEAIALDPENPKYRHNAAHASFKLGYFEYALEELEKCLYLDKTFTKGWALMGEVYLQLHKPSLSLECFAKWKEVDPSDPLCEKNVKKAQDMLDKDLAEAQTNGTAEGRESVEASEGQGQVVISSSPTSSSSPSSSSSSSSPSAKLTSVKFVRRVQARPANMNPFSPSYFTKTSDYYAEDLAADDRATFCTTASCRSKASSLECSVCVKLRVPVWRRCFCSQGCYKDFYRVHKQTHAAVEEGRFVVCKVLAPNGFECAYFGEIDADTGLPHGQGTARGADGTTFDGQWDRGRWEGLGRVLIGGEGHMSGKFLLGTFVGGEANGHCVFSELKTVAPGGSSPALADK